MKTVTLRFDDDVKDSLDEMLNAMGMNIATFYNLYTLRALRDRKIPFEITAPVDSFYSDSNRKQIAKARKQIEAGNVVKINLTELEAMADE